MPDCSFGTIPFRMEAGIVRFLLIWEIYGKGHWDFPKGHREGTETPIQTALRELKEETGLVPNKIVSEQTLIRKYSYRYRGRVIKRHLEYFLASIDEEDIDLQFAEVSKYQWMTLAELLAITPLPELKQMARQAHAMIIEYEKG